jgi:uncharacterized RDD family membrane protein YckC
MEDILNDFYDSLLPASRLKRWLASFVDYLLCFLMTGGILYFFDGRANDSDGERLVQFNGIATNILAVFLPWLLVLPGIETMNKGKTLGKALFHIKAIKSDGARIDFLTSIIRHLFDVIDFLPFAGIIGLTVASNNKKSQRTGDLVAKTIVVDER